MSMRKRIILLDISKPVNGYVYSEKAIMDAIPLFERAMIYAVSAFDFVSLRQDKAEDVIGNIKNVRLENGILTCEPVLLKPIELHDNDLVFDAIIDRKKGLHLDGKTVLRIESIGGFYLKIDLGENKKAKMNIHRGYILETGNDIFLPISAPIVAEGNEYPVYRCLPKEKMKQFCSEIWMQCEGQRELNQHKVKQTAIIHLFEKNLWEIVKRSFLGVEPTILILTEEGNVKIKLFTNQPAIEATASPNVKMRVGATNSAAIASPSKEFESIPNRTRIILELEHQEKKMYLSQVAKYKNRLDKMTDEQLEREYHMVFGEKK